MPKLKPETHLARREHILDAAERCFVIAGFHGTSMQDILSEAAISPGALYVYFGSKEALIEGICTRDRAEFARRFAEMAAAPDFLTALQDMAEHYFIHEPQHRLAMMVEIGAEAIRNETIGEIFRETDRVVATSFRELFQRLADEGRIAPELPIDQVSQLVHVIGDGLLWRRAVDPDFDGEAILPGVLATIGGLLRPTSDATLAVASKGEPA